MIKDLKELEAFLKLCRKQGVTEITCEGVRVVLGEQPKKRKETDAESETDESMKMPATFDQLSPEEQMFYSTNGGHQ